MEFKDLYKLNIPTKVYYGREIWKAALSDIADNQDILHQNVMIVTTGRSLNRLGYVQELKKYLEENTLTKQVTVYDQISANPKLSEVADGVKQAQNNNINTIIGFGGGSAVDAAKAIAAGAKSDISVSEMFRKGMEPQTAIPLIAMPTTAGTGSELSKAAILTDEEEQKKGGLRGNNLYPNAAIVDSSFTDSVPFQITMETGFDVLAHAIESYVSNASSPFTEMLSLYVVEHATQAIRKLIQSLADQEARDTLCMCSMIMGVNLGNASTALPHRMQYPLGAHTTSSHGAGLAMLYCAWMKYEKQYSTEKVDRILKLMDCKEIKELLQDMHLTDTLSDIGLTIADVEQMVSEVSGNIKNDPAAQEADVLKKIYMESL